MSSTVLVVATRNPGKMREYRELLADWPVELISLDDAGVSGDVDETGDTFLANARLKASEYARLSNLPTISDDSGLEVHALGGDPGVYSARYGGDACRSDGDRVALLLNNLAGVLWDRRIARFRCVTAIAAPGGAVIGTAVGSVAGMIQFEPEGEHGFGYDPVFYLPSLGQTIAEAPLEIKNRISHRSDAARKARTMLPALLDR
ncbi:MAG: RdgB/HAM1 family non-canonical purine NTP pyrophosphatase [Chloroflexi bacterium]|nr:RdgB/HAM1 family non-canonical purine NTP pyrophosphatase [Chloroflexota bacterium]